MKPSLEHLTLGRQSPSLATLTEFVARLEDLTCAAWEFDDVLSGRPASAVFSQPGSSALFGLCNALHRVFRVGYYEDGESLLAHCECEGWTDTPGMSRDLRYISTVLDELGALVCGGEIDDGGGTLWTSGNSEIWWASELADEEELLYLARTSPDLFVLTSNSVLLEQLESIADKLLAETHPTDAVWKFKTGSFESNEERDAWSIAVRRFASRDPLESRTKPSVDVDGEPIAWATKNLPEAFVWPELKASLGSDGEGLVNVLSLIEDLKEYLPDDDDERVNVASRGDGAKCPPGRKRKMGDSRVVWMKQFKQEHPGASLEAAVRAYNAEHPESPTTRGAIELLFNRRGTRWSELDTYEMPRNDS